MTRDPDDSMLQEMAVYYRERAAEYDEWFYRRGRYDKGQEVNGRWFAEAKEVFGIFDSLGLKGEALELAPGTGIWTERLVRQASRVTAIDASEEMIQINRVKLGDDAARVDYVLDDLFEWRPDRAYDCILFCFWLSHVPLERLDGFLAKVASALRPGGKLFFCDSRREEGSGAQDHHLPNEGVEVAMRRLNDGREYQIVKNFHRPDDLRQRFDKAGLVVHVRETADFFIYGDGVRR